MKYLKMDSIKIVSFAEKVNSKYRNNINLKLWVSLMEMNTLINLSLENVVNFIANEEN